MRWRGRDAVLPFANDSFDFVYSYGVLHHSPDTAAAVREVHRVLRPGGVARIMIYHRYSVVGAMLWARYALLAGRLTQSLDDVYAEHLESPGTKAFSTADARKLFASFAVAHVSTRISFGDLLMGDVGERHRGPLLALAKTVWPRWALRRFGDRIGLGLFVEAIK